jgi:thymidylate synthase
MEQISREPKPLPKLVLPDINSLDDLKKTNINDYVLDNYDPHPAIKAKMAI